MGSTYYTEDEAKEKVGKEIKTRYAFAGVPEGTAGKVTEIFETPIPCPDRFGVYVTWHLPGSPLIDGYSKDEYVQFLEEIEVPIQCLCKDCRMTAQMCRHRETGASTPNTIQLLAATLDKLDKDEIEEPDEESNAEFSEGVFQATSRIRDAFGIPKPKGG